MLLDELRLRDFACTALLGAGGKTTLQTLLERECARAADPHIFYEAETTGGKNIVLHAAGEPVLRPETDSAVVVAGLSALDWPLREVCVGWEYAPAFAADPSRPCDGHDLLYAVRDGLRASGLPKERLRILLNQADTGALHVRAADLLRALQDEGYFAVTLSLLV